MQGDFEYSRAVDGGNRQSVSSTAVDGILAILLIVSSAFILVIPSVTMIPDVLKSSLGMASKFPAALPALAEHVLGPSAQFKAPFAINNSSKVGNDGGDGVDASEALQQDVFEEDALGETDGSERALTLSRNDPSSVPLWRNKFELVAVAHSENEDDGGLDGFANMAAVLGGDFGLCNDRMSNRSEAESRVAVGGEERDGVDDIVAVMSEVA